MAFSEETFFRAGIEQMAVANVIGELTPILVDVIKNYS